MYKKMKEQIDRGVVEESGNGRKERQQREYYREQRAESEREENERLFKFLKSVETTK